MAQQEQSSVFPEASNESASAYDRLRQLAIDGGLRPEQRLTAIDVGRHLGVSVSLGREILLRLAGEGFIAAEPGRGYFTKAFVADDQRQLMDLAFILFSACVERALPQLNEDPNGPVGKLLSSFDSDTPPSAYAETLDALNYHIADAAGNGALSRNLKRVMDRTRLIRRLDVQNELGADHAVGAMRAIGYVVRRRDAGAVTQITKQLVEGRIRRLPDLVAQANAKAMRAGFPSYSEPAAT
jgi:DNA-binding GntR family transcriptional regulator